jgi:2,3-dihydroxybenzoate-AMP ligase
MSIAFNPWPADLAAHYRAQGHWLDLPMTDILERRCQADPLAPARD